MCEEEKEGVRGKRPCKMVVEKVLDEAENKIERSMA